MEIGKAPVEADYTTFASWKQARNAWDSQRRALQRSEANRQKQDAAALQVASDLEAARQWYGSEAARLAINTSGYHGLYKPPLGPPLRTQPYKRLGRPCKQPLEAVVLGGSVCSKSRSGWPTELRSLTHSPGGTRYPSVVFGHNLPAFESEDFDEVRSRRASNIKREARALKRLRSFKVAVDAAATCQNCHLRISALRGTSSLALQWDNRSGRLEIVRLLGLHAGLISSHAQARTVKSTKCGVGSMNVARNREGAKFQRLHFKRLDTGFPHRVRNIVAL